MDDILRKQFTQIADEYNVDRAMGDPLEAMHQAYCLGRGASTREVLLAHKYHFGLSDYDAMMCECGATFNFWSRVPIYEQWLAHIEEIERKQLVAVVEPIVCLMCAEGNKPVIHANQCWYHEFPAGSELCEAMSPTALPPQRSMTPEESANLAAYHKTKFQRVAAQDDGLREAASKLVAKLDLIHADERYKEIFSLAVLHGFQYTGPNYETELANLRAALASEKAAPEDSK